MVNLVLIIAVICYGVSVSEALFFSSKVNCLVSTWSAWSEPDDFGQRFRRSKILRLPLGGGRACPHILEVKDEGRNSTSWSGWSGLFGFEQISRHRTWFDGPRTSPNYTVAKMSTFKSYRLIEEDIRYTGVEPGITATISSFVQSFVLSSHTPSYIRTPPEQHGKVRDIVLVLDSSGSIGKTHFEKAKTDAMTIFSSLCPAEGPFDVSPSTDYQYQQLAMITFSTTVDENFFFNTYSRTENVINAISNARYHGHASNTAEAFRKAKDMFQTSRGARNAPTSVTNEVLILTDGRSNRGGDAVAAAKTLSTVAKLYGLMIGQFSAAGMEELTSYVSKPASEHLFNLESYESLSKLAEAVQAMKILSPNWCAHLHASSEEQ